MPLLGRTFDTIALNGGSSPLSFPATSCLWTCCIMLRRWRCGTSTIWGTMCVILNLISLFSSHPHRLTQKKNKLFRERHVVAVCGKQQCYVYASVVRTRVCRPKPPNHIDNTEEMMKPKTLVLTRDTRRKHIQMDTTHHPMWLTKWQIFFSVSQGTNNLWSEPTHPTTSPPSRSVAKREQHPVTERSPCPAWWWHAGHASLDSLAHGMPERHRGHRLPHPYTPRPLPSSRPVGGPLPWPTQGHPSVLRVRRREDAAGGRYSSEHMSEQGQKIKSLGIDLDSLSLCVASGVGDFGLFDELWTRSCYAGKCRAVPQKWSLVTSPSCSWGARPALCTLHTCYRFVRAHYHVATRLWDETKAELVAVRGLLIFSQNDWTRAWNTRVFSTDSSLSGWRMTNLDWPELVVGRTGRVSERRRYILGGPEAWESALAASRVISDDGRSRRGCWRRRWRGRFQHWLLLRGGLPSVTRLLSLERHRFRPLGYRREQSHLAIQSLAEIRGTPIARAFTALSAVSFFSGTTCVILRRAAAYTLARDMMMVSRWIMSEMNTSDALSRLQKQEEQREHSPDPINVQIQRGAFFCPNQCQECSRWNAPGCMLHVRPTLRANGADSLTRRFLPERNVRLGKRWRHWKLPRPLKGAGWQSGWRRRPRKNEWDGAEHVSLCGERRVPVTDEGVIHLTETASRRQWTLSNETWHRRQCSQRCEPTTSRSSWPSDSTTLRCLLHEVRAVGEAARKTGRDRRRNRRRHVNWDRGLVHRENSCKLRGVAAQCLDRQVPCFQ